MKFSNLLLSVSSVLAKKFIIQSTEHPENFFTENVNENVIHIGDVFFTIIESESFPIHLYSFDSVESIEEDGTVSINDQYMLLSDYFKKEDDLFEDKAYYLQNNPTWGLDRTDQRSNKLNQKYYYPIHRGENVDVYVIDTGIDTNHPEFEGRAIWGANFVDQINTDCNGHSTHVAGSIGSKSYGVAKKSTLIAVKVLGCDGSGSFSGVLSGFEYSLKRHKKNNRPSVINMSLGGGKSSSINRAVSEMVKNGISVVVAAGNENQDACNVSPASAPEAITVGATSQTNQFASFSNYGKCVNILAPGVDILSTVPGGKSRSLSGTSMASPHVAGVVALILNENPDLNPVAVKKFLEQKCTTGSISNVKNDTPNCMLYAIF